MKPVIELSSAGTGPLYIFTRRYGCRGHRPRLLARTTTALHAPNENIRLDFLEKGMLWMGQTIENYVGKGESRWFDLTVHLQHFSTCGRSVSCRCW